MSKDLSVSILMDFYAELLTEKQQNALNLYYNNDYSLAEIAENTDISRQGVRDFIKKGEKQLIEFERVLKMAEKFNKLSEDISELRRIIRVNSTVMPRTTSDEITKLLNKMENEL